MPVAALQLGLRGQPSDITNKAGWNRGRRDRWGALHDIKANGRRNTSSFIGQEPSLEGHINDTMGEQNLDQYIKVTKEKIRYVLGKKFTK
jgi:hypothetical protein